MPLKAVINSQEILASDLHESDRKNQYFCPFCNDKFIVVLPEKQTIINHFRHRNGHYHGEPESFEHLGNKQIVFDTAKSLGYEANLEYIIDREREYIADVLVSSNNVKVAVECQCSQTTLDYIISKTNFYIQNSFVPLWIFGIQWYDNAKYPFRYNGYNLQRISQIEKLLYRNNMPFFYCSDNDDFYKFIGFKFRWAKGSEKLYTDYLGWFSISQVSIEDILRGCFAKTVQEYLIPQLLHAVRCKNCGNCSNVYVSSSGFDNHYYRHGFRSCLKCGFTYDPYDRRYDYFLTNNTMVELQHLLACNNREIS